MHDLLKRVQKLFKILHEKAEVADPEVMVALGKVLAFFLNLDRVNDEPLCREACNFVPTLARGWTYRGAEFAMIVTPDLLACLEKGGGPVSSSAYQSMCAIVSHCYEAEGRLLALFLGAMDGNIRRQLYQLIKIAIEKWPPSSVQAHMPAFREVRSIDHLLMRFPLVHVFSHSFSQFPLSTFTHARHLSPSFFSLLPHHQHTAPRP